MRIAYIDKLKGLTILLVIMGHISQMSIGINFQPFNQLYTSFHMPLFMFLSGIFAYKGIKHFTGSEVLTFLRKKALRILVPFIMVGGLFLLVTTGSLTALLHHGANSYWFLPCLFYCMVIGLPVYYLAHAIEITPPTHKELINNLLLGLLAYGCIWLVYLKGPHIPCWLHTVRMFPYFYGGVLLGLSDTVKRLFVRNPYAYAVAVVVYFALQFTHIHTNADMFIATGFFAIIILMQLFCRYDARIPAVLAKVGNYSLEIYVLHYFFLPSMPWLAEWLLRDAPGVSVYNANFVLMLLISFTLAAVIAFLCIMLAVVIHHSKILSLILLGVHQPKRA